MDAARAARIAALKLHPAWSELVAVIDEEREKYAAALAKKMLATGEPFENFDYKRGVLAGMRELVRYPERAAQLVAADAAKQRTEAEEAAVE